MNLKAWSGSRAASLNAEPRRQWHWKKATLTLGSSFTLLFFVLALAAHFVPHAPSRAYAQTAASQQAPIIGTNPNGVSSYDMDRPYADVMRSARSHWDTVDHFGDAAGPQDANGWPTGDASIVLWEGIPRNDGTYRIIFNGQATLGAFFGLATFNSQSYDPATNTTTANMVITDTGPENFGLILTNTKRTASSATNTGVTNLKVMRPTAEGAATSVDPSQFFNPLFKQMINRFSLLRFMDWSGTNGNTQVNWSDRKSPTNRDQTSPVAWEYIIQLCNETNKDMYINIPHNATGSNPNDTSSYIYQLAKLIRDGDTVDGVTYPGLNPNLHVYVEWSNEVWNWIFQQSHDNYAAATAEVNAGGSPLNFDGDTNTYEWGWRRIANRIKQTSDIFRAVFSDGAMPPNANPRIRPVFEFQYQNYQNTASLGLTFLEDYYDNGDGTNHVANPHPVNYYLWGAGGASYYSGSNDSATTVDGIFSGQLPNSTYTANITVETAWSKTFGLHDIAYEGGWAVGGDNPNATQSAAWLDPRTTQTLLDAQTQFNQLGGDVNILYYSSGLNRGMTDDVYHQNTPLLQAVDQLNQSTQAAVTHGTQLSSSSQTTIQESSADISVTTYGDRSRPVFDNSTSIILGYLLVVNTAGNYQLSFTVANSGPGGQFRVLVDGVPLTTVSVPNTGSTNTYQSVSAGSVFLSAGQHGLLLRATANATGSGNSAGNLQSLVLQYGSGGSNPTPTPTNTPIPVPTTTPTPIPTTPPTSTPTPVPSGTLLATDPFNGTVGAIQGQNTGSGWARGWNEQQGDTSVPGYNIASGSPLSYSTLNTSGNYAVGGDAYQTLGRSLDVSASGPFSSYLSNGQIGQSGTTLWVSLLLRKDGNNDQEASISLHNQSINWYTGGASSLLGVGYFGSASNTGGTRYWSLKINNTIYQTSAPVTIGQTALLVLRLDFGSTSTAALYVNPSSLGGNAPATANVQQTASTLTFQSLAYYGGDTAANSSLDEIRFGTSYSAVTPTH